MPSPPRAAALIAAAALTLTAADHTPPTTTPAPNAVSPAAAIGTTVTAALATPDTHSGGSDGVEVGPAKWPLRGNRAGDLGLLARAEHLWRTTPDPAHRPPQGSRIRPLFAADSPPAVLRYTVVILIADHAEQRPGSWVGVVTTRFVGPHEQPDTRDLRLRATGPITATAPAVGMLTTPAPDDTTPPSPLGVAVAVAAPETTVALHTAMDDHPLTDHPTGEEVLWRWTPAEHNPANTTLIAARDGTTEWVLLAPATTGPHLRPLNRAAGHRDNDGHQHIDAATAAPGDIVAIAGAGVVGAIDDRRRLDTRISTGNRHRPGWGARTVLAGTDTPVTVTTGHDGTLHAQPANPERLDGVRVDLHIDGIRLALGHLAPGPGGTWTITRLSTAADLPDHRAVLITPQPPSSPPRRRRTNRHQRRHTRARPRRPIRMERH